MNADTTHIAAECVSTNMPYTLGVDLWMIVAVVELLIIIYLLLRCKSQDSKRASLKKKVLAEGDVDFANIMNSSFNAEPLYRQLLRECHPDRFAPNATLMAIANDITMRVTMNRHDIKALNDLRKEAKDKLNINF